MKFTIRTKLMAVGVAALAIMGGMTAMTWTDARIVGDKIEAMKERTSLVRASAEGDMMHDALRGDVLSWLLAQDEAGRNQAVSDRVEHAEKFRELLTRFEQTELTKEEAQAHASASEAVEAYIASAEKLMASDPKDAKKIEAARADFDDRFEALETQLEAMSALVESSATTIAEEASLAPVRLVQHMMVTVAVGAVLLGASLVAIARSIISRANRIRAGLDSIGAGDLTKPVGLAPTDELGEVGERVDQTRTQLAELLRAVQGASQNVNGASERVTEIAEQLNTELQRQHGESTQVAVAVEELAASVNQVSEQGTQVSEAARVNLSTAGEGSKVVDKTVHAIREIASEIAKTSAVVNELGQRGERIGAVVSTIDEIADQTNLLALNAAIAAARAGAHGRGFAVVADEVRKLAERTQRATEEVAKSIREMQVQTTQAVAMMREGHTRVGEGVTLASDAGQALSRINTCSSGLTGSITAIAAANEQQASATTQIGRSVQAIQSIATASATSAAKAVDEVKGLRKQSDALMDRVKRFRF
jgi:methyl-accepting chemotaxis protein